MKSIKSIILILSMVFMFSCMDMYNEIADEYGAEYKYFLAVANGSAIQKVSTISLDSNGNPSPVSKVSTTDQITFTAAHPSGKFIYTVSTSSRKLFIFRVLENGAIELIPEAVTISANGNDDPSRIEIDPSGRFLYIFSPYDGAFNAGKIFMFKTNEDGTVTSQGEESLGQYYPANMTIDPSGKYFFITHEDGDGFSRISMYQIDSSGKLIYIDSENNNTYDYQPFDIKTHPTNHCVYITGDAKNVSGNFIYQYQYSSSGLVYKGTVANGAAGETNAGLIEIHPSGNYLYATCAGSPAMYDYKVLEDGSLQSITPSGISFTTSGAIDCIIHPKDNYLYISHQGSDMIIRVKINSDGSLGVKDNYKWDNSTSAPYTGYTTSAWGLALIRQKKL